MAGKTVRKIIGAATALFVSAALAGPLSAQEQVQGAGMYVYGFGGLNLKTTSDITSGQSTLNVKGSHGAGYLAGGALGLYWDPVRFEVEYSFRSNPLDDLTFTDDAGLGTALTGAPFTTKLSAGGHTRAKSWFVNAYYDFETEARFRPYIGAGLGVVKINRIGHAIGGATVFGGEERGFAGQFMTGFRRQLAGNVHVDVGYRFYFTERLQFASAGGGIARADYIAHSLTLGLVVQFGGPQYNPNWHPKSRIIPPPPGTFADAPPPMPPVTLPPAVTVPIVQPLQAFMVYFDFDLAIITADARAVIEDAAAAFKETGMAEMNLIGHTDRSGSDAYNLELSDARASAVKAILVELGIGDNVVTTIGQGEFSPQVMTEDGVREPKNRRVSITLKQ